ncbi:MAG: ROK family protein [Actinomycetaceae bacterium]|nr:ROK family protein [Actinomycetaceae bacterium]
MATPSYGFDRQVPPRERQVSFTHVSQIADVVSCVRSQPAGIARSAICRKLTLGRNAVEQRLRTAVDLNLITVGGFGASTGGRAPKVWQFNPAAGTILVVAISIRSTIVALTDLGGKILHQREIPVGILVPPAHATKQILQALSELRAAHSDLPDAWGCGLTVPLPVDVSTGRLVNPVAQSTGAKDEWVEFPVKETFARTLGVPVWIEDEVDAMAHTAALRPGAPPDLLYVRLSLGLGLGIVSGGKVHRGSIGTSGELAHIQVDATGPYTCRCGRRGCLETYVSGGALEQAASKSQVWWKSPYLRSVHDKRGQIRMEDVFSGVAKGDAVCTKLAADAGIRLAGVLAVLVTTYNPGEIVIGGAVTESGNLFASVVDRAIRSRVLPASAERLSVRMGGKDRSDKLEGAAHLVVDWLLKPASMALWLPSGSPARAAHILEPHIAGD